MSRVTRRLRQACTLIAWFMVAGCAQGLNSSSEDGGDDSAQASMDASAGMDGASDAIRAADGASAEATMADAGMDASHGDDGPSSDGDSLPLDATDEMVPDAAPPVDASDAAPPDTTPPTVPTGLTQTSATPSSISLSWTASTDPDSPVSGYNIYRNGTKIGASGSTSYTDTGLGSAMTYIYAVSAYDPSGNTSAESMALKAMTNTAPDTTPPTVPTGLFASGVTSSSISLAWTPSTDPDSAVAGYNVYRNGTMVGTPTSASYTDTGLTSGTLYAYTVSAYDPSGNTSAQSSPVSAQTTDITPPTVPTGFMQTGATTTSISFTWTASTDPDSPVAGYTIYRGGTMVGTSASPSYTDTGLTAGTLYSYTVSAYDPSSNTSAQSAAFGASTSVPVDTTPPTVPGGLKATGATTTSISLSWTASTDPDSPVAGYNIYRNGTKVGTSASPSYADTGLTAGTTYSYTVSAYDPTGNTSIQSAAIMTATNMVPDTTPPSVPTGLAKTGATSSSISLSWTASTDPDSPVAGYNVYRNGTKVGTPASASYTDTALSVDTSYSYTVSAYDPTGNTSALSAAFNAATSTCSNRGHEEYVRYDLRRFHHLSEQGDGSRGEPQDQHHRSGRCHSGQDRVRVLQPERSGVHRRDVQSERHDDYVCVHRLSGCGSSASDVLLDEPAERGGRDEHLRRCFELPVGRGWGERERSPKPPTRTRGGR